MGTETQLVVNRITLLNAMEKAGFIKLHHHTGEKVSWNGRYFRVWYVDDGDFSFTFRGRNYRTIYKSGSFFPYVYEIIKNN